MNDFTVNRHSAPLGPQALGPAQGAEAANALERLEIRPSEALRAHSLSVSELEHGLHERLEAAGGSSLSETAQMPDGEQVIKQVKAEAALETSAIGADSLTVAAEELAHSGPALPFTVQDALDFRTMMTEAGKGLADSLFNTLGRQIDLTPMTDAGSRSVAMQAARAHEGLRQSLDTFKQSLGDQLQQVKSQAQGVQVRGPTGKLSDSFESLMSGEIKKPWDIKSLWKHGWGANREASKLLAGVKRNAAQGGAFVPPGPPLHLQAAIQAHLKGLLKHHGLSKLADKTPGIDIKNGMVKQMSAHVERSGAWSTQTRPIDLKTQTGATLQFTNTLTPARDFSPTARAAYGNERQGVSCMNKFESSCTSNLWKTEFSSRTDPEMKFSALRHGINDAYGLKDAAARKEAADAKTLQLLQASVEAYPDRLQHQEDGTYAFTLVSTSLVSPGATLGQGDEKAMWEHQRDAYQRINERAEPIEMRIPGHDQPIQVRPRVIAFNTPVNSTALEKGGFMQWLAGGVKTSAQSNDVATPELLSLAREHLKSVQSPEKRDRIESLIRQIETITREPGNSERSWQKAGNDPYKLAKRIVVLANEIGAVPAFNCKSGKDRTGELDVQAKEMYAHWAENGSWPDVGSARTAHEEQRHVQLILEGGTFDIQKVNTSMPGSKVEAASVVRPLLAAMGTEATPAPKEALKGLSRWV